MITKSLRATLPLLLGAAMVGGAFAAVPVQQAVYPG